MNEAKTEVRQAASYSSQYEKIKKRAESTWPAWKVTAYNANVATSAHAKKVKK